jgi:NAD(P)-dependent dehydrogenase (short-subunit alcohol dehydrogenase family)
MLNLSGRVAVVTGAGSGIGKGIALGLAQAGAAVLAADIVESRAFETAAEIKAAGGSAASFEVDVRDRAGLLAMAAAASSELGGLDIAVANAGIGRGGSVLVMAEDDWDRQVAVNMKGVFLTVQACAREMVRQGRGGRVITIASLAAERASAGMSGYCGTKAAVRMMSRCWAQDLAPFGITVNSIGPGIIDTPLAADLVGEGDFRVMVERGVPLGRVGYPADIGRLACWLASDEAEYVTGTYNLIDGGLADRGTPRAGSPQAELLEFIHENRGRLSGEKLLGHLDQAFAEGRVLAEDTRRTRGLQ